MQHYDVERMIEDKTSRKVSLNSRINQCGFCGDTAQKVCWECFQNTIDEMQAEIDKNKTEIDRLNRIVKVLMLKNGVIYKEATS